MVKEYSFLKDILKLVLFFILLIFFVLLAYEAFTSHEYLCFIIALVNCITCVLNLINTFRSITTAMFWINKLN